MSPDEFHDEDGIDRFGQPHYGHDKSVKEIDLSEEFKELTEKFRVANEMSACLLDYYVLMGNMRIWVKTFDGPHTDEWMTKSLEVQKRTRAVIEQMLGGQKMVPIGENI